MALKLSCAFATSLDTPEHTRVAEELGYERAWFYDSPALYPDIWVQLCRAAELTDTIGLGTGVLVPHLRHPMTNAAAIATLVDVAGAERVAIGIGTGFQKENEPYAAPTRRPRKWRRRRSIERSAVPDTSPSSIPGSGTGISHASPMPLPFSSA